jgi:hypothetical protein
MSSMPRSDTSTTPSPAISSACSALVRATTSQPRSTSSWIAAMPTPPDAPVTSTRSPATQAARLIMPERGAVGGRKAGELGIAQRRRADRVQLGPTAHRWYSANPPSTSLPTITLGRSCS